MAFMKAARVTSLKLVFQFWEGTYFFQTKLGNFSFGERRKSNIFNSILQENNEENNQTTTKQNKTPRPHTTPEGTLWFARMILIVYFKNNT